jgi:hypothetical protein
MTVIAVTFAVQAVAADVDGTRPRVEFARHFRMYRTGHANPKPAALSIEAMQGKNAIIPAR